MNHISVTGSTHQETPDSVHADGTERFERRFQGMKSFDKTSGSISNNAGLVDDKDLISVKRGKMSHAPQTECTDVMSPFVHQVKQTQRAMLMMITTKVKNPLMK